MLSKKSKYAVKALVALAKHPNNKPPLRISELSKRERIPKKFLETILLELRNQGYLGSKKGVHGGYYLIKNPEEIILSNVLRITDGPIALLPCVSLNFYEKCNECISEETCSLRNVAIEVREASLKILTNTSIADMVKKELNFEKKLAKQKTKK